jgi:hypothetical protein
MSSSTDSVRASVVMATVRCATGRRIRMKAKAAPRKGRTTASGARLAAFILVPELWS